MAATKCWFSSLEKKLLRHMLCKFAGNTDPLRGIFAGNADPF